MMELVIKQNGKSVTNSLLVAQKFGKRHSHVIDAIRKIIYSAENSVQFYVESNYFDSTGRELPMFIMDRDGFSLLVMGFTGKDAMNFKLEFINAFNTMESKLREIAKPLSTLDMLEMSIKQLREQEQRVNAIENDVLELKAATKTRPDYFTIVGYATLNKINVGLTLAAKLGSKASRICKAEGFPMEKIPDPRFGVVNMYPKTVLKMVFEEAV